MELALPPLQTSSKEANCEVMAALQSENVNKTNSITAVFNKHFSINKLPTIKKAKLVSKLDTKKRKVRKKLEKKEKPVKVDRAWKETKIFFLPLMPTEQDEKDVNNKALDCVLKQGFSLNFLFKNNAGLY